MPFSLTSRKEAQLHYRRTRTCPSRLAQTASGDTHTLWGNSAVEESETD